MSLVNDASGEGGGFIADLSHDSGPIVVYGAHLRLTDLVLTALKRNGLRPVCITDGRRELAGGTVDGIPILTPEDMMARYHDARVLICPSNEFLSVWDFLWENGMSRLYDVLDLTSDMDLEEEGFSSRAAATMRIALETQRRMVESRRGGVAITQANFIVTEFCNLNCRYCCNLMPYITDKQHYPVDGILGAARRLESAVDSLVNVVLVGGEPFLYPDAHVLIREFDAMPKVERVSMFSNGGILPRAECLQALREAKKSHVIVSDYGPLSAKTRELGNLFDANEISHDIRHFTGDWRDMGGFAKRGRPAAAQRAVFRGCWTKNCSAILDGRLYRCPRAAFGARIGKVANPAADFIDLRDETQSIETLRKRIDKLVFGRDFIAACDFCDGMDVTKPPIDPAVQQPRGVMPDDME